MPFTNSPSAMLKARSPAGAAAFLSAVSAIITIALANSINADATFYLIIADAYKAGGLAATTELYDRPFYSILIGLLSETSSLSSYQAANILNTGLFALLGFAFVRLVQSLEGSKRAQWLAALTIIAFPTLANYRDYLIKDFGYWAFMTLSISEFLFFQNRKAVRHLALWLLFGLLAVAFRPEGLFIIAVLPMALLFTARQERKTPCSISPHVAPLWPLSPSS